MRECAKSGRNALWVAAAAEVGNRRVKESTALGQDGLITLRRSPIINEIETLKGRLSSILADNVPCRTNFRWPVPILCP